MYRSILIGMAVLVVAVIVVVGIRTSRKPKPADSVVSSQTEADRAEFERWVDSNPRAATIQLAHRDFSRQEAEDVAAGNFRVGMSFEAASLIITERNLLQDINRTQTQFGTRYQIVLKGGRYLYFDADKLTTIQD